LTYPDGVVVTEQVDSKGQVSFKNLPRGQYQLQLSPAAYSPPTPVALSRPQDANLRVITYLDVALGAGVLILAVALLFVIGRWAVIWRRLRRRPALAGPELAPAGQESAAAGPELAS
jgi:hypothetical protein